MTDNILAIVDDDRLLRRAFFTDPNWVRDDMTVTSLAFKLRKGEDGLSVDMERLTTYQNSISDTERFRLFAITAGAVRGMGLECLHKPEADNFAHAEIVGEIKNRHSSLLAKEARYIAYP